MENKFIYTITAIEDNGTNQTPHHRCFGFFFTMKDARDAVKKNLGSMSELRYDYIVIEQVKKGISMPVVKETWFYWHNDYYDGTGKWIPRQKPKNLSNIVNWSIG